MLIFVYGMKKEIIIAGYWISAIFLTSLLLTSLEYSLWQAVLMSLSFLPAAMALSFFLPRAERQASSRRRVLDSVYIFLGVLVMTFLFIFLWQWFFRQMDFLPRLPLPSMLTNPVFVSAILAILAFGHYRLSRWLRVRFPSDRPISFTSDYRKVSLQRADILYVESHDSEVWIFTRDGRQYRNRAGITQWENLLGPTFLRIHRSYLVSLADSVLVGPDLVSIGGQSIPVSRKYRENVKAVLSGV